MLRRVRHKLRMIRYYSAHRPETAWTRAFDRALIVSFFLAFPATWICNTSVMHRAETVSVSGQLLSLDGRIMAVILATSAKRSIPMEAMPLGTFSLRAEDRVRGWPLTTSIERMPARLDLDIVKEPKTRKNAQLPADDPYRAAIELGLDQDGQAEALAARQAFAQSSSITHQHWMSWLIATGVWWLGLMFASWLALGAARIVSIKVMHSMQTRKQRLRAEGKCHTCGYDMTGLEFNEKCPECGNLVW